MNGISEISFLVTVVGVYLKPSSFEEVCTEEGFYGVWTYGVYLVSDDHPVKTPPLRLLFQVEEFPRVQV